MQKDSEQVTKYRRYNWNPIKKQHNETQLPGQNNNLKISIRFLISNFGAIFNKFRLSKQHLLQDKVQQIKYIYVLQQYFCITEVFIKEISPHFCVQVAQWKYVLSMKGEAV